ncbi:MAG: hypothetical protein IKP67_00210, partial [Spirochaetales bacterium]|nr:hypothetical protein [Spirochaetales bacterium]
MTIPAAAANADYSATLSGTLTATRQKQDSPLTVTSITGTVQDSRGAEKAISDWADHIAALNTKTSNLADSRSIYIDTTAPTIQSVSTAASDGWYRDGSHIYLTLTFDEDVQISGSPALTLSSGGTAIYQSNSGPEVTFLYTVGSSDSTSGQTLKATGIVTNSGTIIDTAKESGNAFDSSALSSKALKKSDKTTSAAVGIDNAITPIVIKNGSTVITNKSYTSDNSLKYYRSQTLTVSWSSDSGALSTATYTVNGESRGIITNGGTISCPLAEDAIASYLVVVTKADTAGNSTSAQTEIQINGEEIKLQSVTSETPNGTYIPSDQIGITLNFNKAVKLTQAATLTLNNGKELSISATNSYSTSISTTYTVEDREDTPDGENLAVSSFTAGIVQDERGTDTARTLSALLAAASNLNESRAIKIDTVKPTLSLMTTSADGWYKANDQIAVTLTFSEEVKVTGTPTITMSTGTTAAYQTGSGTKNLMFVYKVAAGNTTGANKNLYISSLSGLTCRITDSAGNAYTPISSEYGTGKLKKASATSTAATVGIDTAAPTLTITNSSDGNAVINDGGSVNKAAAQTIKFTLSDGGSALNSSLTKYTVNGTSYPLTNNETLNCAETAGTKNAYAITATVTDNAGNVTTKSFTVIIDGTPLMLETITSTQASGTYKSGVTVPITLTFNNPVKVTSALTVTFNNGDTMTIPVNGTYKAQISADYSTSSETSTPLTVSSITGTVEDARGTVKAISTTQWSSALSAANNLDASKSIIIDTTAPTVSSVTTETAAGWYKAETLIRIMLNCNETVKVSGTPTLSLNLTNGATTASYISGSGTNTLTFAYTVQSSDSTGTSQNLSVTRINGTITDIADNTISTIGTKQLDKNIGIDTSAPKTLTVSGITANAVKYDASALTISNFGDSTGSGNASYTIVINGTSYSADKTNTTDITYSGLPSAAKTALTVADGGRQTFTVTAYQTDKAGNNSASSSSLTFTIDKNPAKIVSVTSSRSNEIIKNGDTLDIVFNFSRALTSVSSPTVTLSNGVTGTLSKVTTTQYKYTYNVSTASSQDTNGAALMITSVSGSITDALTTQTLSSLWTNNTTYNISGYNVIVDTIVPTLKSSYPTASYNDSTGKATVTYKFSENVEKVGGKKFTLTRTAYAAPIILTPAEYNEYVSQASGIAAYYEKTINGTSSSGVVDKTSKYVLKYQYDPTVSALLALFSGIGYYQSEITIESSNASISGDTLTVTIPAEQLMTGESYTISADTGLIKDLVGNQCGTIANKTFTTGNKPQPPVIRVLKKSGRGTTAAQTTFKVNTVTSGATVSFTVNGSTTTNTTLGSDNDTPGTFTITATASKSGSTSATAYEKAFKTVIKSTPKYWGPGDNNKLDYTLASGEFIVFRGADVSSGSSTVDNFPLSWDEKSIGSSSWYPLGAPENGVNTTAEESLAQYGMLLAENNKAITWGATEKIYFHGLICKKHSSGKFIWKWQQNAAKTVNAGSSLTDDEVIEANYHDYDGKNY